MAKSRSAQSSLEFILFFSMAVVLVMLIGMVSLSIAKNVEEKNLEIRENLYNASESPQLLETKPRR